METMDTVQLCGQYGFADACQQVQGKRPCDSPQENRKPKCIMFFYIHSQSKNIIATNLGGNQE